LVKHRDILTQGDAKAFVAATGTQWLNFQGISAYRSVQSMFSHGKKSTKAWQWHTLTVDGQEYCFEAFGNRQWVFMSDSGRFAWRLREGRRRILEGTLRTKDNKGRDVVRGERGASRRY